VEAKFENCKQLRELPERENDRILMDEDATLKSKIEIRFRELRK
jgi:hypothetical protein